MNKRDTEKAREREGGKAGEPESGEAEMIGFQPSLE